MAIYTAYSTSSDGYLTASHAVFLTAHGAATGTVQAVIDTLTPQTMLTGGIYYVLRVFLFFTIPAEVVAGKTAAILSVYGKDGSQDEFDAGHSDLGIFEGVQDDPLQTNDYGDHVGKTILGADTYYAYPLATDAYTGKALNAIGLGWIAEATKFCLRLKGDRDISAPGGLRNRAAIWANEEGAGFLPKLAITYTPPVVAGRSFGHIIG